MSWTSILYYGSIALLTLGTLYVGYIIYCDITTPRYVSLGKLPDFSNYPDHPNNNSNTIDSITKLFSGATASFIAFNKSVFSYLNPVNYMSTPIDVGESREAFMARQQSANDYNSKYWPYTEVNPFHSYFHKWRIYLLGETLIEQELREHTAKTFKDRAYLNAKYGEVSAHIPSGSSITPIGIGTPAFISDNSIVDSVNIANVNHKLNSIPSTPVEISNEWTADSTSITG